MVEHPEGHYINWHRALRCAKQACPLPKLPLLPHDYLDPIVTVDDPEILASDPEPTLTGNRIVLERQAHEPTRCNSDFGMKYLFSDFVLAFDWIAEVEVITHSTLLSALEKRHQWNRTLIIMRTMHCRHVRPNVIIFIAAIRACADLSAALELLQEMRSCQTPSPIVQCWVCSRGLQLGLLR